MKFVFLFFSILFFKLTYAQVYGCTDLEAKNYNPNATINDGSCYYKTSKIKPIFSIPISEKLDETSGLLVWKDRLWSINDDGDTQIYSMDTLGNLLDKYPLKNVNNKDWEAFTQDDSYLYVGDFGNNVSGNRKDLYILKIEKKALLEKSMKMDTIAFSFENQMNFEPNKTNKTDFDCETLIATQDSLYLFTKEWSSKNTRLYVLPKAAGQYIAKYKATLNVNGLITGGVLLEEKKTIALCGYSKKLQPFLYLLYDYKGTDFFSGNKRKIKLRLPFHQVEGIATSDGLHYYITNENFQRKPFISTTQQLHKIDLNNYLKTYLSINLK